jgi:hypothetical protein
MPSKRKAAPPMGPRLAWCWIVDRGEGFPVVLAATRSDSVLLYSDVSPPFSSAVTVQFYAPSAPSGSPQRLERMQGYIASIEPIAKRRRGWGIGAFRLLVKKLHAREPVLAGTGNTPARRRAPAS